MTPELIAQGQAAGQPDLKEAGSGHNRLCCWSPSGYYAANHRWRDHWSMPAVCGLMASLMKSKVADAAADADAADVDAVDADSAAAAAAEMETRLVDHSTGAPATTRLAQASLKF
jgi:hypothetical protein